MNFNKAVDLVFKAEGGYVNDPDDKGGETIFGISRKSHPESKIWAIIDDWKTKGVRDPKIITKMCWDTDVYVFAREIYRKEYWDKCKCDDLPELHRYPIFNCAVNCGVKQAVRFYQFILGVEIDGVVGEQTISVAKQAGVSAVLDAFFTMWRGHYKRLASVDPKNAKYLRGWLNRVEKCEKGE